MTNLWEETMKILAAHGKTFKDVLYIQGSDFRITKKNFEKVAKKSNYDSGYGAAEVAEDLVIVGDSWWLERHEYDGNEWWEFNEKPRKINKVRGVNYLVGGVFDTLALIN